MADKFLTLVNGVITLSNSDHGGLSGLGDDDHTDYVSQTRVANQSIVSQVGIGTNPLSMLHIAGWLTLNPAGGFAALMTNIYYADASWRYIANGCGGLIILEHLDAMKFYMATKNEAGPGAVVANLNEYMRLNVNGQLDLYSNLNLGDQGMIGSTGLGGTISLTNYALWASVNYGTILNAPAGKYIELRINNASGLLLDQNRVITLSPASATAPIILSANGQGHLITGLNADQIDGIHLAGLVQGTGVAKISVGTTAPDSPATGDLWVDTN